MGDEEYNPYIFIPLCAALVVVIILGSVWFGQAIINETIHQRKLDEIRAYAQTEVEKINAWNENYRVLGAELRETIKLLKE